MQIETETPIEEAAAITAEALKNTTKMLDDIFGYSYSLKNPHMVSALIRAQLDYCSKVVIADAISELSEALGGK